MAYKSLFIPITSFEGRSAALDYAQALAAAQDAHLDVMCLGLSQTQSAYYEIGSSAMILQAALEASQHHAENLHKAVSAHMDKAPLRYEITSNLGTLAGMGTAIAAQARFADLAVTGLPYGANHSGEESLTLEGLLFDAECPTLVVPDAGGSVQPASIVIGWDEGKEALNAVRAALPFLKAAKTVHIAIVDPPQRGPERSDPGGNLAVYLARHGIVSDIQVLSRSGDRISDRLARHATEMEAEMLVIGAYGHSRLREAILGGVTRDMLEHSKVPVLMCR